jgi:hypothetical protein
MRYRVHQVGLAEADTAIKEKRIECHRPAFGNAACCGMGQFVRFADNESIKRKARIKLCTSVFI